LLIVNLKLPKKNHAQVIGKIGTDIEDSKCSWLVVNALERASEEQRAVIKEHYGRHEKEHVAKIKEVYVQLELEALFKKYESDSYDK
jgi:farnesyl diphosphate synthase